jgi:hypothetical protein
MSEDWCTLREHLAQSIDQQIANEPDRELRAVFERNRDRIVDQVELITGCWPSASLR